MSTNNDGWILMSERKPTQFPVWLYDGEATDGFKTWMHCNGTLHLGATHWKPAAADIPAPPREKTQMQKDEGAWADWYLPRQDAPTPNEGWHAALAYERAEVGNMLPEPNAFHHVNAVNESIQAIRARCGGGK